MHFLPRIDMAETKIAGAGLILEVPSGSIASIRHDSKIDQRPEPRKVHSKEVPFLMNLKSDTSNCGRNLPP